MWHDFLMFSSAAPTLNGASILNTPSIAGGGDLQLTTSVPTHMPQIPFVTNGGNYSLPNGISVIPTLNHAMQTPYAALNPLMKSPLSGSLPVPSVGIPHNIPYNVNDATALLLASGGVNPLIMPQSLVPVPDMSSSLASGGANFVPPILAATITPLSAMTSNGELSKSNSVKSQKRCTVDTTNHYHIFVGDLSPEVETEDLRTTFSAFGDVTECKVIKDMHTQKPKGYGFVSYSTKEEALQAIFRMNGQTLGARPIRTNWAVRRPLHMQEQKPLDYDEVLSASSTENSTVYVGGITQGLSDQLLRNTFKEFGEILETRLFKDKGYAFVRFDSHQAAAKCIVTMHGKLVAGQVCKCSWGKESISETNISPSYIPLPKKDLCQVATEPIVNVYGGCATTSNYFNFIPVNAFNPYIHSIPMNSLIRHSVFP